MLVEPGTSGFEFLAHSPRAALLIVHGLAEYAGRYRDLAATLADRGISCFAYDQRGHGTRPGTRTHVERFDDFVDDLNLEAESLRRHSPDLPLFVWGHSMGSIVVIGAVRSARHRWRGCDHHQQLAGSVPARAESAESAVSSRRTRGAADPRSARARRAQDLDGRSGCSRRTRTIRLIPPTASLRLIVEFAAACERCRAGAAQMTLPWLVVHGEADAIAPVQGSRVLFDACSRRTSSS